MRPAISPSGTLFVMISQEDMVRFRMDQGVSAFGVLAHLMARVSLDHYRTQVRNFNQVQQWLVPMQFAELQEITGMSTDILMLTLKVLEDNGWVEQTKNGYLLHDAVAREKQREGKNEQR